VIRGEGSMCWNADVISFHHQHRHTITFVETNGDKRNDYSEAGIRSIIVDLGPILLYRTVNCNKHVDFYINTPNGMEVSRSVRQDE